MHIDVAVGRLEVLVNSTGLHADQIALETICAVLAEKSPSASTNTGMDAIAVCQDIARTQSCGCGMTGHCLKCRADAVLAQQHHA